MLKKFQKGNRWENKDLGGTYDGVQKSSYENIIPHYTITNSVLKRKQNYSMININGVAVHNQISPLKNTEITNI